MPWYFFALVCVCGVSIATLLERLLMREEASNPVTYAIVFQFMVGIISLIFTLLLNKFVFPPDFKLWPRFLASSFLWAGMTVFNFKAIKSLSAGEITILGSSGTIISIILGVVFLGEALKISVILGTLLIFVAILIINSEKLSFNSRKGVLFALLSAACGGIAVANDAVILKSYEAFSYMAIISLLPGFVLLSLFPKYLLHCKQLIDFRRMKIMSIFCMFYSIQGIAYYLAFQKGAPVSQLSPLVRSSIVLTVILGAIFLKEKQGLVKNLIAGIIVTIGVILVG
ncbi:MAG: DMT family transporter [Candidatus Beckwithbacteria bacterium]